MRHAGVKTKSDLLTQADINALRRGKAEGYLPVSDEFEYRLCTQLYQGNGASEWSGRVDNQMLRSNAQAHTGAGGFIR